MTLPPFALVGTSAHRSVFTVSVRAVKTALCFLVPPFQIETASLGFNLGMRGSESNLHSVSAVSVRAAKTAYPLAHSSFPN